MNAEYKDLQINKNNLGCKQSLTITISVTQRVAAVAKTLSFSNISSHGFHNQCGKFCLLLNILEL